MSITEEQKGVKALFFIDYKLLIKRLTRSIRMCCFFSLQSIGYRRIEAVFLRRRAILGWLSFRLEHLSIGIEGLFPINYSFCPCLLFRRTLIITRMSSSLTQDTSQPNAQSPGRAISNWRDDLLVFRGLGEQERTGFLMVLEWFENFRLRCNLPAGREAAIRFWKLEVIAKGPREDWQLEHLSKVCSSIGIF